MPPNHRSVCGPGVRALAIPGHSESTARARDSRGHDALPTAGPLAVGVGISPASDVPPPPGDPRYRRENFINQGSVGDSNPHWFLLIVDKQEGHDDDDDDASGRGGDGATTTAIPLEKHGNLCVVPTSAVDVCDTPEARLYIPIGAVQGRSRPRRA